MFTLCCLLVVFQVDMSKVNLDTIKPWITQRVTDLLGIEDDVVVEFIFNLLEKNQVRRHLASAGSPHPFFLLHPPPLASFPLRSPPFPLLLSLSSLSSLPSLSSPFPSLSSPATSLHSSLILASYK